MQRNIPTRVGKTITGKLNSRADTEHPHACGENENVWRIKHTGDGTSPRGWGKRGERHEACLDQRNIPTRVGKTLMFMLPPPPNTEHPHACGENTPAAASCHSQQGTSPRVWGKHQARALAAVARRNIPTRVGKTSQTFCSSLQSPEHPHACGENVVALVHGHCNPGTSPRVWGKPSFQ